MSYEVIYEVQPYVEQYEDLKEEELFRKETSRRIRYKTRYLPERQCKTEAREMIENILEYENCVTKKGFFRIKKSDVRKRNLQSYFAIERELRFKENAYKSRVQCYIEQDTEGLNMVNEEQDYIRRKNLKEIIRDSYLVNMFIEEMVKACTLVYLQAIQIMNNCKERIFSEGFDRKKYEEIYQKQLEYYKSRVFIETGREILDERNMNTYDLMHVQRETMIKYDMVFQEYKEDENSLAYYRKY